jgi:hypothetical protein
MLVVTEGRSVAGVLDSIAQKYRVGIASTGGFCAGFLHTTIAPMIKAAFMNLHKPPQVLYIGDHDLCGNQIEERNRSVIEKKLGIRFEENWERVPLTEEQVRDHGLEKFVKVKTDRRHKDQAPHRAIEAEALGQRRMMDLLNTILQTKLNVLLPEPLEKIHEREKRQRRAVRNKINPPKEKNG